MIRYSNNLYRALKYINEPEILDCPKVVNQPDCDNHIMEIMLWYLILNYYLICLNEDECDEKEAESIKEKIDTLFWMIPKKYLGLVMSILDNEEFNNSGYMIGVVLTDTDKPRTIVTKRNN